MTTWGEVAANVERNRDVTMSWRAARALLTDSGRGANEAQDILDELARKGPGYRGWSVRTPEGAVLWLRYAGLRLGTLQPEYTTTEHEGAGQ